MRIGVDLAEEIGLSKKVNSSLKCKTKCKLR